MYQLCAVSYCIMVMITESTKLRVVVICLNEQSLKEQNELRSGGCEDVVHAS